MNPIDQRNPKRVAFTFDERSYETIDQVKARTGMKFVEVEVKNPETGEMRTMFIPDYAKVNGS